jgi:MHS family citrate/tricarballylate:H+ symporter-like MFS transporter
MTAATADIGRPRQSKLGAVLRVTSGNFLEQFDFFLFGFYATYIAKTFFPAQSEFASLMLTFSVFGAGFLMRPLGAIILGAYIDQVGRRKGLIVTLAIMASGTVLIAFVPGYATIGLLAPLLVLLGRLLQGFSAGRSSAEFRSTWRKWPRRVTVASTRAGNRRASRSPLSRPRLSVMRSMAG